MFRGRKSTRVGHRQLDRIHIRLTKLLDDVDVLHEMRHQRDRLRETREVAASRKRYRRDERWIDFVGSTERRDADVSTVSVNGPKRAQRRSRQRHLSSP